MKTVVTGGAGFIGSHLVKRLLEMKREVVVADDFSRGSLRNLRDLGLDLEAAPVDLRDYRQARAAMEGAESVFHLAARVGSVQFLHGSELAELLALQTNLVIDANVLRACLESGIRRLVYASSVSVYPIDRQQSHGVVFAEDDLRYINPEGGYGWAKLVGEIQLQWMRSMKVGIARIFNVYGEGEDPTDVPHVIPDLMRKAACYPDVDFRVWGDGNQTRDFLYVADCIAALLRLEERASWPLVVVNIGSGHTLSIRALAEKVIEVSGKNIQATYETDKPVGPLSRTADISRARSVLSWEPRVDLDQGLSQTFRWVAGRLRAPAGLESD